MHTLNLIDELLRSTNEHKDEQEHNGQHHQSRDLAPDLDGNKVPL